MFIHTIRKIGKDCQVITENNNSLIAMDSAVDDYAKGKNVTTRLSVSSSIHSICLDVDNDDGLGNVNNSINI